MVTMYELKNVYTLDEFIKLSSLWTMEKDIEAMKMDDYKKEMEERRH